MKIIPILDTTTVESYHNVPTADVANNVRMRDAIGNKADAAVSAVAATKSVMGYVKGIIGAILAEAKDSTDNYWMTDVVGNKEDTPKRAIANTYSAMAYLRGLTEANLNLQDRVHETHTGDTNYYTALDLTGPWRLYDLTLGNSGGAAQSYIRITADGGTPVYCRMTGATGKFLPRVEAIMNSTSEPGADDMLAAYVERAFVIEGATSLKLEIRTSDAGETVTCNFVYAIN